MSKMTKGERVELGQLIRKRERVMKAQAAERSVSMLADFETQCASIYSFDQDEVWKQAFEAAEKVIAESVVVIKNRCEELGIPKEFAPNLSIHWWDRGENAVAKRRAELRNVAKLTDTSNFKNGFVAGYRAAERNLIERLLVNRPEALAEFQALPDVIDVHYDTAYGTTPALFVRYDRDDPKTERVRLEAAERESEWVPVKDARPADNCPVLITDGRWVDAGFLEDGNWYWATEPEKHGNVIAWKSMDKPFEGGEK